MQTQSPRLLVVDDDRAILTLVGTGVTCLDVLRALRNMRPHCEVVFTSGYESVDAAIQAVRRVMEEPGAAPPFPPDRSDEAPRHEVTTPLIEVEREHIVRTLEQVHGNKAVAARMLGISRRAFYRQLERHGLHQRIPMSRREEATPVAAK